MTEFETPEDVKILDGFCGLEKDALEELYRSFNLAMTFKDFEHIQNYYRGEEKRDPSVTEIRVLDTYWSDHCRHTTFSTELKNVTFTDGDYRKPIEDTYHQYLADRASIYGDRKDKYVCLMDLATMAMEEAAGRGQAGGHGGLRGDQRLQHRGACGDRRRYGGVADQFQK